MSIPVFAYVSIPCNTNDRLSCSNLPMNDTVNHRLFKNGSQCKRTFRPPTYGFIHPPKRPLRMLHYKCQLKLSSFLRNFKQLTGTINITVQTGANLPCPHFRDETRATQTMK